MIRLTGLVAAAGLAVLMPAHDVTALRPHPLGYVAYRATTPIVVDGRIAEAAWTAAAWSHDFVDIEGDAKPRPQWPTHVKMLWDDTALYIAAELREPHVWATLTAHDSVIFRDNDFEVFVDPDADNRAYGELEINALGTTWDLFLAKPYRDGGKADDAWEMRGLKSAVSVDGTINDSRDVDRAWSVELAIPWAALADHTTVPVPPHDGNQWRINFSRVEWTLERAGDGYRKVAGLPEHNWVWSPQWAIDMHRPEMWGYLQFSTSSRGPVSFVPDSSWPARAWLYDAYYAQRDFKTAHGRFAQSLAELGVDIPPGSGLSDAELTSAGDGLYSISVVVTPSGGRRERWHMSQESAIGKMGANGGL